MEINTVNLVKRYRGKARPVVNGISLDVKQSEVVGLLGPNGAGKTTTFYMIVGLVKPNAGTVMLDNVDITRLPMYKRARAGISYLPQEASVFRNLSVQDNLKLVLQLMPLSNKERVARCDNLLEDLHITRIRHSLGKELSGGERRRVEIARALATEPKFILLDEPFTGVDPKAIEDIEIIIYRLSKRDKIGILITDHNVEAMLRITERAYIIADGEKRFEGPSNQLMDNAEARESYFGEHYGQSRNFAREAAEAELRRMSHEWDVDTDRDDDAESDEKPDDQKRGKNKRDDSDGEAAGK